MVNVADEHIVGHMPESTHFCELSDMQNFAQCEPQAHDADLPCQKGCSGGVHLNYSMSWLSSANVAAGLMQKQEQIRGRSGGSTC